jgi:GNAT superfamily N-acetyltransferase
MRKTMPDHPIALRVATPGDIPGLFSIRTAVRENHLDLAGLAERGVTPASVAAMLDDRDARTWVVEEGGEVVAFSMANAQTGSVFAVFVRSEAEGRGYGRAILAAAEEWLFAAGWDTIWLETGHEPHFRAHRLYRAAGWKLIGPADHDDVRYEKSRARSRE